ncbi:hypothetical protein N825_36115, partial [Skermanella stibiiresistens SB22]
MSQYDRRDDQHRNDPRRTDPGQDPYQDGYGQDGYAADPDPAAEDARYMPRDLRVEPRGHQRGSYRPNPDARPSRGRRRLLAPILAAVGLMLFFAIVWFTYNSGQDGTTEGGMPLIKADGTPTKLRPDQPGGMNVPHQDKLIYDRLKAENGNTETAAVERLLPPPESPLPRPEPPAAAQEPAPITMPPGLAETEQPALIEEDDAPPP